MHNFFLSKCNYSSGKAHFIIWPDQSYKNSSNQGMDDDEFTSLMSYEVKNEFETYCWFGSAVFAKPCLRYRTRVGLTGATGFSLVSLSILSARDPWQKFVPVFFWLVLKVLLLTIWIFFYTQEIRYYILKWM